MCIPFYLYCLQEILHFSNLMILYMHGNHLRNMEELSKLKPLLKLRTLTLHGNPISRINHYRQYVVHFLPQIRSLDFSLITHQDRKLVRPTGCTGCIIPLKYWTKKNKIINLDLCFTVDKSQIRANSTILNVLNHIHHRYIIQVRSRLCGY